MNLAEIKPAGGIACDVRHLRWGGGDMQSKCFTARRISSGLLQSRRKVAAACRIASIPPRPQ